MNDDTKLSITVILSLIVLLSPFIAEFILNQFVVFELHETYYLTTRTDFSIGIKLIAFFAIVVINRKK